MNVHEAFWYSSRRPDASGISRVPCTYCTQEMIAQTQLQKQNVQDTGHAMAHSYGHVDTRVSYHELALRHDDSYRLSPLLPVSA